jgi:hypothetical protein
LYCEKLKNFTGNEPVFILYWHGYLPFLLQKYEIATVLLALLFFHFLQLSARHI